MSERQLAMTALAMWVAALAASGAAWGSIESRLVVAAIGVVAWRTRRAVIVSVALVLFTWLQGAAAWAALNEPVAVADVDVAFVLATDPQPTTGGARVRAVIDGRTYDLRAWGSAAGRLRPRLMGERIEGRVALRPLDDAPLWLRAQGVAGRGTVKSVDGFTEQGPHLRLANSLRRTIEAGAASLSRSDRSLFTGLVYGDDRSQSPLTADDFAGAGLTHLLAVSGQNVAFVLAIAGPALRRMNHRSRLVAVALLLVLFAAMTRFEASVVRASVMAAIAAVGALVGTRVPATRVLLLTVIALLAFDPLLVHSVAFQLSLAASGGILLWSARVARSMPGPRPLIEALAVTATAQIAVAPLLLWRFGGVPVASLPANVLAGPAAGPVMMWGMTGGVLAGLVPDALAELLHLPTRMGVWWISGVAAWSAQLPLGEIGWPHVVICVAAAFVGLRGLRSTVRRGALVVIAATLLAPAVGLGTRAPTSQELAGRSALLRDEATTVLFIGDPQRAEDLLADLRRSGARDLDLVITQQSSFAAANVVGWIKQRHSVDRLWSPSPVLGKGEVVPLDGTEFVVAGQRWRIVHGERRLQLHAVQVDGPGG